MQQNTYPITRHEEETVLQILTEVDNHQDAELDSELEAIIKRGETEIQAQYAAEASHRMLQNRQGINFDQLNEYAEAQIKEPQVPEPTEPQLNQLQQFQQETVKKSKLTEIQIMELDRQFPKLNYTGMVGQQQNVLGLKVSAAANWIKKQQKQTLISAAIINTVGEKKWIILAVENELAIFMGEQEKEPNLMPMNGKIGAIAISPCKKYLAVGVKTQINVYQIKKTSSLVLIKNFPDLNSTNIKQLMCYQGAGPRVCFADQLGKIGLVSIEIGIIMTKVRIDEVKNQLKQINSFDIVRTNQKCTLIAIGGIRTCKLLKIQPSIELIQEIEVKGKAIVSWRRFNERINLLIATDNSLTIYKLVHQESQNMYYLQQYLLFLNHYQIQSIYKLSEHHYLLESSANFSIVALPLIPSYVDAPDLAHSQSALVFNFQKEKGNKIIFGIEEGLLLMWDGFLQCGRLKSLEEEAEDLMIQKCAFRQAFSLLVLVCKGINYSFRFSYKQQDLNRLIHSAVETSISALIPSLDDKIVLFRVGWIVQLCVQCHQQQYMWNTIYYHLKQKSMEKHLFRMIQMFILKGQLVAIPENIFLEIIDYYSEKGKESVIEKLVLSNREQYEATKLLSLLNQKQMNYLQFYLFSRAIISDQHDFYTPFIRAFSAFVKNQDQKKQKKDQSALLCYWILSKTFNFQHVPTGQMTRDTKVHITSNFFLQTLAKTFLKKLSQYNTKLYLQCYLIAYMNAEFIDILLQEEKQIMISFKELDIGGEIVYQSSFANAFLNYLENCSSTLKMSPFFAEFSATVIYLTRSQAKFQKIVQLLSLLFEQKFYQYKLRAFKGTRPTVAKLKQYLLAIIKQNLRRKTNKLYINKLLTYQDRQVGHILYCIDLNYSSALETYLNNHQTNGIFQLITSIHQELEEMTTLDLHTKQRKKIQVRNFVIKNISLIFTTNSESALQICYLIGETTQKIHDIVFKNPFEKNHRIHFLTAVLSKWKDAQFQHKEQYQLEHLQQVCMLPESQMRQYLNQFYYPLEPAIKVAQKKNNFLAKAILEMKFGLVEEAFSSYQKLIQNTLIHNKKEQEIRIKVGHYLQQCIYICKQYAGDTLEKNLWVRLIRFLSNVFTSEHQYKIYLKVELERCTQHIINQMLKSLNTPLLIKYFTAKSIPLPFFKLIPIYAELFRMAKFDRSTIQRSILIIKQDTVELGANLSNICKIGTSVNKECDFCKGKLQQQHQCLIYSCGHAFHLLCHQDSTTCLTCSYESDNPLFNQAIFKKNDSKHEILNHKQPKKNSFVQNLYVQTKDQAYLSKGKRNLKLFQFQIYRKENLLFTLASSQFQLEDLQLYTQ